MIVVKMIYQNEMIFFPMIVNIMVYMNLNGAD